jgi:hypothetical protein
MPAVSKKQQNFMQAVANNPKFADKVGVNQSIGREFTKEKSMNTKRMNRLEELGRVDNEKAYTQKGKNNLMAEKERVVGELKAKTGGMLARTGGSNAPMDAKGKKMMKGGKVGYEAGGKVKKHAKVVKKATRKSAKGKASKRADGIAQRGRTKGRMV